MSKKIPGLFAFLALFGLSAFLLNCGTSTSRPAGVLYVLSQGASDIGSYAIDLGNGNLSLINSKAVTDTTPSSIILDPTGAVAFVLNTGSNTITSYTVNKDGSLTQASGSTSIPVQNSVAMALDAAGKFLFVVSQGAIPPPQGCPNDLPPVAPPPGCPAISVFATQPGSAALSLVVNPGLPNPLSLGRVPTSVAASITVTVSNPDSPPEMVTGTLLYITSNKDLLGSNDNTVSEHVADGSGIVTAPLTGSPSITASDPRAVLAVHTTPTGGSAGLFVYVTNVTTNNISVYQVCVVQNATCSQQDVNNATMLPVGSPESVGLDPVAMVVDPTNNFLYVVNKDSSEVSGFRINPTSGVLSALNPKTVSTGAAPVALTIHSSGKFLYVSNNGSSNISGFNVNTTSGALSTPLTITSSAQPAGLVAK
jgi:6-phosphogluconolactonase (cycloisomerase 2 family)